MNSRDKALFLIAFVIVSWGTVAAGLYFLTHVVIALLDMIIGN